MVSEKEIEFQYVGELETLPDTGCDERPQQPGEGVQHGREAEERGPTDAAAQAHPKARPQPPSAAAPDLHRPGGQFNKRHFGLNHLWLDANCLLAPLHFRLANQMPSGVI